MMVISASLRNLLFFNYAQLLCKNEAQSSQKWCELNFDDGFKFTDVENPPTHCFTMDENIRHYIMCIWGDFCFL